MYIYFFLTIIITVTVTVTIIDISQGPMHLTESQVTNNNKKDKLRNHQIKSVNC